MKLSCECMANISDAMTDAYVDVYLDGGSVTEAAQEIKSLDKVGDAHLVTGAYDIVAQLDLDDQDALPDVVANEIHEVTGVVDTITHVAYEP